MKNLVILILSIIVIIVTIISAILKNKKENAERADSDGNDSNGSDTATAKKTIQINIRLILFEVIVAVVTVLISIIAIQVDPPTNYSDNGGIMDSPDAVVRFGDYSWPTQVWYCYDSNVNPVKNGMQYTEPFIPTQTGDLYYKARFFWVESSRESFYVQTYEDRIREAGITLGDASIIPVVWSLPSLSDDKTDNPDEPDEQIPEPAREDRFISQSFMDNEDDPPGEIKWGWGDTTDGGQGRESYTVEDINNGLLGRRIVFNSISNSTIGDEKNFVGARIADKDEGEYNFWYSNLIEVEAGNEYYIRLFGHNNSPYGYDAIADDVKAMYMIPQGSGRTIVVNGQISSTNADPDRYWDSVVFTCNDRFHLEYVEGSALLENNGIGAGEGVSLSDSIVDDWVNVGFDALDGRIPGCYKYDFYITIKVKVVAD